MSERDDKALTSAEHGLGPGRPRHPAPKAAGELERVASFLGGSVCSSINGAEGPHCTDPPTCPGSQAWLGAWPSLATRPVAMTVVGGNSVRVRKPPCVR